MAHRTGHLGRQRVHQGAQPTQAGVLAGIATAPRHPTHVIEGIAANHEAVGKGLDQLQPRRLERAFGRHGRCGTGVPLVDTKAHEQIGVGLQPLLHALRMTGQQRLESHMRPDETGLGVVREQAFEGLGVLGQGVGVERVGTQGRRQGHGLGHQVHVQVDGQATLGRQISQQEVQRVIGRHRLVGMLAAHGRDGDVVDAHLADAHGPLCHDGVKAGLETGLDRIGHLGCRGVVDHHVERTAAHDGHASRVLVGSKAQVFDVVIVGRFAHQGWRHQHGLADTQLVHLAERRLQGSRKILVAPTRLEVRVHVHHGHAAVGGCAALCPRTAQTQHQARHGPCTTPNQLVHDVFSE